MDEVRRPGLPNQDHANVLVVEDDVDSLDAISQILNYEGISTVGVRNGAEALEYLSRHESPDVILLDLYMPLMSGREFRKRQLADPKIAKIPTVALTAAQEEDLSLLEGVSARVAKPVDLETILGVVRPYVRH